MLIRGLAKSALEGVPQIGRQTGSENFTAHRLAVMIAEAVDPTCETTQEEVEIEYGKSFRELCWDVANHLWRYEPCGETVWCFEADQVSGHGHYSKDCPYLDLETRERIASPFLQ